MDLYSKCNPNQNPRDYFFYLETWQADPKFHENSKSKEQPRHFGDRRHALLNIRSFKVMVGIDGTINKLMIRPETTARNRP